MLYEVMSSEKFGLKLNHLGNSVTWDGLLKSGLYLLCREAFTAVGSVSWSG